MPLFSKERYELELQHEKRKEEKAFEKRLELIKEKEMVEDMEIALHQITNSSSKFDPDHFEKRYQEQVKSWTEIHNQSPERFQEKPVFKPQINKISQELTTNLAKIEDRMKQIQDKRKKNIEALLKEVSPSFSPEINKKSKAMVEQKRSLTPDKGRSPVRREFQSGYQLQKQL